MWKKWNIHMYPHKYTNRNTHKQIMIYNIDTENETGFETDNDNDNDNDNNDNR